MSTTETITTATHHVLATGPIPPPAVPPPKATRLNAAVKYLKHPPRYALAALLTSTAGILFGLDTGMIGPITVMTQFSSAMGGISSTLHGLIVSTILIPAAAISFFSGHLSDRVGRPAAIAIGTGVFGLGAALEAGSVHIAMLFVGRVVAGLGEGLFLSTLVVYICEISPPRERGALASMPQLIIVMGICTGYFVCYGTVKIPSSVAWRLPFALQAGFAEAISVCAACFLPESPRWLTAAGRKEDANRTWDVLGVSHAEREKVEEEAETNTSQNREDTTDTKKNAGLFKAFGKDVWKRTALGCFLMGFQQAAGIDGILYYAPLLFQQAGLSSQKASFLASGVSALLMLAVTIPATSFSDSWGRRTSVISGGILMTGCMLLIGSLYASSSVHPDSGVGRWVVIVAIYVFVIVFSITWAVGVKIYASEIQPPETRAAATSLAYSANWIVNWIVAFTTPIFLARSSYGAYFLFGGCTLLAVLVCIFWMPETRRMSLEGINGSFSSSHQSASVTRWARKFTKRQSDLAYPLEHAPHTYRRMEDALVL